VIRIENLSKRYGPKVLFHGASWHFPEVERIALVGANGVGKTTLLKILCGIEEADGGQVAIPASVELGYLPQVPNPRPEGTVLEECLAGARRVARLRVEMESALAASESDGGLEAASRYERAEAEFRARGGWSLPAMAQAVLKGLRFSEAMLRQNPATLSPGWRMRLELARLLVNRPDFLVLDEPTNHLDLPSLVWVEEWLLRFRGTLLFVSHDRALLNRLATMVLHLNEGVLTPYRGNFDAFLEQRDARLEQQQQAADRLRRRREEMESFVRRFGAKATKAKQAQSRVKMIQRLRALESQNEMEGSESREAVFSLPETKSSGRDVLTIRDLATGYDKPLHRGLNLDIQRGQRVAVIGANGVGKSTLLKTIAGEIAPLGGALTLGHQVTSAWYAQEQSQTIDGEDSVLGNLTRVCSGMSEKEARSLLGAFLFHGDDVFKKARVLSGGEMSRLGLARTLARATNLLLLDEPTNHLDMTSCASLLQALDLYEGTVIFVSHDRTFVDGIASHVLALAEGGKFLLVPGNLSDYERMAQVAGFPNVLDPGAMGAIDEMEDAERRVGKEERVQRRQEDKERQRDRARQEKRLRQLEERMEQSRGRLGLLETDMAQASSGGDFARSKTLSDEYNALRQELERLEEEWLLLADALQ
jgi:ATP-binding cassette subfamily F protein 3